tara:strand:- start:695 stop:1456 length:762 start_codon:yes stop_codon:yes gene_type:complete
MKILKTIAANVWPEGNLQAKARVVGAMALLVGSKALNVQVPFIFKYIVDNFTNAEAIMSETASTAEVAAAATTVPLSLLLMYGAARVGASFCNEARNAVFAKVGQDAIRKIAADTFSHLHQMDLQFHLARQTGGLSRAIERGSRGINFIMNALVFNILPTIFEIGLVSGILWYTAGPQFAAVSAITMSAYTAFTLGITGWRTKFRKHMNAADNKGKQFQSMVEICPRHYLPFFFFFFDPFRDLFTCQCFSPKY